MKVRATVVAGVVVAGLSALACAAQQPKMVNAQVSVKAGGLQQEIAAAQTATWVGYSIAVRHTFRNNWDDSVAYLEPGDHRKVIAEPKPGEPGPRANVLVRVTAGKVERVQIEDVERTIDAGGLPVVWLSEVKPAESVKVLAAAIEAASAVLPESPAKTKNFGDVKEYAKGRAHMETALVVLGLEDAPEAMAALRGFTAEKYPEPLRDKAAFWLANEGGREGLNAVTALLKSEKSEAFREKLVFDLTLVKGDAKQAATDELLAVAKNDASTAVRGKAQFWLAQMAGKKAEGDQELARVLSESAKNDPEVAMRKSAVFALSRLPEEQGVPELIQVASTSKDPITRREAITWLGRAKDPRALAYLEKVVKE